MDELHGSPYGQPEAGEGRRPEVEVVSRIVDLNHVALAELRACDGDPLSDMDRDLLTELEAPPVLMEAGYNPGGGYFPEPTWRLRRGRKPNRARYDDDVESVDDDDDGDDDGEVSGSPRLDTADGSATEGEGEQSGTLE